MYAMLNLQNAYMYSFTQEQEMVYKVLKDETQNEFLNKEKQTRPIKKNGKHVNPLGYFVRAQR